MGRIWCRSAKGPGLAVHEQFCTVIDKDGLIRHEFTSNGPSQSWLTDITEHRTVEGKLSLCAIRDVFRNKIFGYSINSRMESSLAVGALEDAVATRDDVTGSMVHSNRGSQFRNQKLPRALAHHRLIRIDRSSRLPQRQHRQGKLLQPVTEEHPHPPLPDHP